ncbi:MAG: tape measure protein [Rubrivivax sp.]
MQGAIQKASHYGGALAVALGTDLLGRLSAIGRSAVQAADDMTNMASRLRLVSGSAVHVAQAQARLFDIAQTSRVSFVALAETYGALARAGSNLGVSQDRMLTVTEAVAQAMALSGGSAESMRAALVQLGQGLASGTLRGEELNSIMEQAPRLAQAMADGLGVPLGRLRSLGEQSKLTSAEVIRALEKSGPQLAKELTQSTLTVGQAMTTLGNSFTRAIGQLDKTTGASAAAASSLKLLSGGVDAVGKAARENEGAIKLIGGALTGAASAAALVASLAGVRLAIAAIGGVLVAHPAVAVLLGIGAAVGAAVSVVARRREEIASLAGKMQELGIEEDKLARRRALRGENNMSDPLSVAMEANVKRLRAEVLDAKQRARDEFRKFEAADMGRASGPSQAPRISTGCVPRPTSTSSASTPTSAARSSSRSSSASSRLLTPPSVQRAAELRKRLAGMRQQEAEASTGSPRNARPALRSRGEQEQVVARRAGEHLRHEHPAAASASWMRWRRTAAPTSAWYGDEVRREEAGTGARGAGRGDPHR